MDVKSNPDSFESFAQLEVLGAKDSVVAATVAAAVDASTESNRENICLYHHHFHRKHCVYCRCTSQMRSLVQLH